VRDDCDLHILSPHSKVDDYIRLVNELPEDTLRLGEMLVRCGTLTQAEVDRGLQDQKTTLNSADEGSPPPLGEISS
jgi:two-component system chemotaxis sensor kinase CheA